MPVSSTSPIKILLDLGINLDNLSDDEDYLSALMEAANGLTITNPGDERIKILQDEIRRVRADRKKASPSAGMKATKKRIGVASILGKEGIKATTKTVNTTKLLAGSPETKKQEATGGFSLSESLSKISESVTSIAKTLKEQQKQEKKESAFDRKAEENRKRGLAETNLEKGFKKVGAITQKILKPVKSILDRIIEFFMAIVIGKILMKFLDWIQNPANQEKIKSFTRFLIDHGPKLLVAFLLFGTTLGRMATRLVGIVIAGAIKLGAAIGKLALAHPKAAAIVGIGALGAWGISKLRDDNPVNEDEPVQGMTGGSFVENYFGPGQVPGTGNKDTVPSMLTPGEFVMSKGAVQKYGVDTLEGMNAAGGGTNKPTLMPSNRLGFKGGGYTLSWPDARDKVMGVTDTMLDEGGKRLAWFDSALKRVLQFSGSRSTPSASDGGRDELFSGFSGRTSKSENYLVRAVNEVAKVVVNTFNKDIGGGAQSGSNKDRSIGETLNEVAAKSGQLINVAKQKGGDLISSGMEAAQPHIQALPASVDMGSLYLKSQLGGMGGTITEADLSNQTKDEYARAYEVAKSKVPQRMAGVESVIRKQQSILNTSGITKEQRKNAQRILNINKSRLARYKRGEVDVQYKDFEVDGKVSPASNAARKTMGAVWASSTKDGGIQIQKEPYDFPIVKDPLQFMFWKKLSKEQKYAWLDKQDPTNTIRKKLDDRPPFKGSLGQWTKQDIAEAMYSLNPAAAPMLTDVKIGGKLRPEAIVDSIVNAAESIPILGQASAFTRGLGMNLLFGKDRDVTKGPLEGASDDSLYRQLFPEQSKPKAQISKTQKPTTPAPPPPSVDPESFANTGTGDDGTFGEGTYGQGRPSDSNVNNGAPNIGLGGALGWIKGVIGLDG